MAQMSERSQPASLGCFVFRSTLFSGLPSVRDRLHRAADDDRPAVGHAAFEAAGVVRAADEAEPRRVACDAS